ncbi:ribose-5-phosphate isomerase [Candidatus Campbellbacteria bacterium CG11_big_fil_rev_8_21_14_0_20_44_21]|uniref:Ribose-5-phosphate isomerase n=1 Tax=Candidatus Campbellbacteria bacterium CG22_combo_CG10-13_8_21_14_all_43_18 TaxID=1974530 RepID=A0A2H0DVW5_9BACT|nr:MAG: ribose-5-phosphate isomerase [Candidatus Campbellbacteria bacterium CG22_combo_CG10-13_8_21_14_all_43_18]PIR24119.1 MAG: ribose-5-phosphate isomerase [Candidatus Campbellbacteria bacterium CG11_big_fil_rev_8_21_14_0_20_44_21]
MTIFLGADHAGFSLKEKLKIFLEERGWKFEDFGAYELDDEDDYNDFVEPVAKAVSETPGARGIVIGASGQGEAMLSNRFANVRAAVYYGGTLEIVRKSREHNDSNILALGARFVSVEDALSAVEVWLATPCLDDEKYERRIQKMG